MSKDTISQKSNQIRNETQDKRNTGSRVADVLDDINETFFSLEGTTVDKPIVGPIYSIGHVVNEGIDFSDDTGGNQVIQVKAVLDATTALTDVAGAFMSLETLGDNCNIDGLIIGLRPGYTGDKTVRGINVHSGVAGAGTLNLLDESATIGGAFKSQGHSTGDNIGSYNIAGFASGRNIAGYFRSMQDNPTVSSTHQIGVMAIAGKHDTLTGNFIGGYFGLMAHHDHRNFLNRKAAVIANNGDIDASILICKSDGVDSFEVKSKGELSITPSTNNVVPLNISAKTGQSENLMYISVGGVEKWRMLPGGDTLIGGRLYFQENGSSSYISAMYCENSTKDLVIRTGVVSNRLTFKSSNASTIGGFNATTNTFYWGGSFSNTNTFPVGGMIIEGKVGIGVMDPKSKLEVDGDIESINANGIILTDTVLGTRHKINLTNGALVVSSVL